MSELFEAYDRTRRRMIGVVTQADDHDLGRRVPACPDWSVHDLIAHVVSMPAALSTGRLPGATPINEWLQSLIEERRDTPTADLIDEWSGLDEALRQLLDGSAGVMFGDLAVHEHDLRAAVGATDHAALEVEVVMPRTLAAFSKPLQAAALGSIEVRWEDRRWCSHDAEPGWVLLVDPWEAVRAVNSRRTAAELRTLPHTGDVEAFLPVLHAHLPLPAESLAEE